MKAAGERKDFTFGEFLLYIGLWLLMATCGQDFFSKGFWTTKDFNERVNPCPFNFRKYMSKRRFGTITKELQFMDDDEPPIYVDKFWQVRQMIEAWNRNMAAIFFATWVICLNESMSIWSS